MQILTVEIEFILGLWLLTGIAAQFAWYVTLLLFCILTCLSFTLAWQGQTDCGCFGQVKVNPWYTFTLDAGIVVLMACVSLFTKVDHAEKSRAVLAPGGVLLSGLRVALFTSVLLGVLALGFTLYFGDPLAAIARLRGETLSVTPAIMELGEGVAGEQRTFEIILRNNSRKPIKVVGGTTSCSCIATKDLPITIRPGALERISINIHFTGTPGRFAHRFVLYKDGEKTISVVRFAGRIVNPTIANPQYPAISQHSNLRENLRASSW